MRTLYHPQHVTFFGAFRKKSHCSLLRLRRSLSLFCGSCKKERRKLPPPALPASVILILIIMKIVFVIVSCLLSTLSSNRVEAFVLTPSYYGPRTTKISTSTVTTTSRYLAFDKDKLSVPSFDVSGITGTVDQTIQDLLDYDMGTVLQNLRTDFGTRGEVYFAAQAGLILCILLGGVPILGEPLQAVLGPLLLLSGLLIAVLSVADLGSDSLSPFPKPTTSGSLKTTGIYAQMRHPMYTGLLMIMLGLSVSTNSADRLLLTGFLYYLIEVKSDKEEIFLMEEYGNEYKAYQAEVPEKFLPVGLLKVLPWTD